MTTPHTGYVPASDTLPAPQEGEPKLALASCILFVLGEVEDASCSKTLQKKLPGAGFVSVTSVEVHAIPTGSRISPWEEQRAFLHSKSQLDHH